MRTSKPKPHWNQKDASVLIDSEVRKTLALYDGANLGISALVATYLPEKPAKSSYLPCADVTGQEAPARAI
jgi:hypothetical protein